MPSGKPSKNPQFKVWHLGAITAVLFLEVLVAAGADYYIQKDTDHRFESLVKAAYTKPEVLVQKVGPEVLGATSPTTCSPCLKKSLNNQIATFSAQAVLLGDLNSGETFAVKQEKALLPIASLTKLMTALTVRDKLSLSDTIAVPQVCTTLSEGQQTLGLKAGQNYKVEDLLYGLLVRSGADCACVLAYGFGGEDALVKAMNANAAALGLKATHFQNTVGNDAIDNYSTAEDLFLLTQNFMKNPVLRKIAGSTYFWGLRNTNELLFDLEGVTGVKTGYTPGAGECLVTTWADRGREFIGVVLGSSSRFNEVERLTQISRLIP
ncbi:MAG: serine hydrolase [bacterium]